MSRTVAPRANVAAQSVPHAIPRGLELTFPCAGRFVVSTNVAGRRRSLPQSAHRFVLPSVVSCVGAGAVRPVMSLVAAAGGGTGSEYSS